jgi:hypothetical protein
MKLKYHSAASQWFNVKTERRGEAKKPGEACLDLHTPQAGWIHLVHLLTSLHFCVVAWSSTALAEHNGRIYIAGYCMCHDLVACSTKLR